MRSRRRTAATFVATSALCASLLGASPSGASSSTFLAAGTVVHHVFVKSFELDHGALTIAPFHGHAPVLSAAQERIMWSTSGLAGTAMAIGLGVVTVDAARTLNDASPRVTSLVGVPAFVGLVDGADLGYNCPVMTTPGSSVTPVSSGWQAVIFPLRLTASDAVFSASSNICGRVRPNTVVSAFETLSVRWHLSASRSQIVVSVPACARMDSWGGGGNVYLGTMSFQATVLLLDRPLTTRCSPATNFDAGSNYASTRTTHGATGPQVQVQLWAQKK